MRSVPGTSYPDLLLALYSSSSNLLGDFACAPRRRLYRVSGCISKGMGDDNHTDWLRISETLRTFVTTRTDLLEHTGVEITRAEMIAYVSDPEWH